MADVFLSYSQEHDRAAAERLAAELQARFIDVWWDRNNLLAGHDLHEEIEKAIDECFVVIVLWSEESRSSRWVRGEADQALNQKEPSEYHGLSLRPALAARFSEVF